MENVQKEKMQELKKNPNHMKMMNEIFTVTNDAIKKEFPVFLKLVQADVSNAVIQNAGKDNCTVAQVNDFTSNMDKIMSQVGKDLEKQMIAKFAALKEASLK